MMNSSINQVPFSANIREKQIRLRELTELLGRAAKAYEQEDREIISNFEYDRLYDELKRLEQETGIVLADSPTINVGYEVLGSLPKEKHLSPMLSLNKTKSRDELREWLGDKEGLLSWKLDGLTIVLTYRDGTLVKAVTRGNGEVGEVITGNAKVFKNVPLTIPFKGELIIRGEAVIKYSDFEKINNTIDDISLKYKNPRNLCSGSVRQLSNEITAKRNVYLYAFALISMSNNETGREHAAEDDNLDIFKLHSEQLDWLEKIGFDVVGRKKVDKSTIVETVDWFSEQIENNDFPSDGLVLLYNNIEYGRSLGRTAKYPRDGIAFKWADEVRETTLREVEWSASRTGLINPIAVFDPVELEGTTVSRASLHNISIMEQLKLGIGDTITVYKANMIIPQIAQNLTKSGKITIPEKCPACGGTARVKQENDVKSLFCVNSECAARRIKLFAHFTGRDAMNIEGLSEATIEKLIDEGMIHELSDIFKLERYRPRIVKMEGFGDKSCDNILKSINKSRTTIPAKLIYSLGIPNIGLSNAKLICKAYNNDIDQIKNASIEELSEIPGVGAVIAETFVEYFKKGKNNSEFEELLTEVIFEEQQEMGALLKDKVFVITGSLEHYDNRDELKEIIEANGGRTAGSVTSKTSYLINNDSMSASSKNKKANELGVQVITEEDFMKMINK